jgi:hypothetical protein
MKCMFRANQNATHEAAGSDSPDLRMHQKKDTRQSGARHLKP